MFSLRTLIPAALVAVAVFLSGCQSVPWHDPFPAPEGGEFAER